MSTEAVNQFLSTVSGNESMLEEVAQAIDKSGKRDREAVVQLAAKYGYEFTADELGTYVDQQSEILSQQQPTELSEDNLQEIAGGGDMAGLFNSWLPSNNTTW